MTIGSSLFLIAVGAILKYAVTAHIAGIDLQVVGVILMIVGVVGLVLGLGLAMSARSEARRTGPPPPPDAY
jgi:predicted ABC-type sugar transport system permease subunit